MSDDMMTAAEKLKAVESDTSPVTTEGLSVMWALLLHQASPIRCFSI